MLAGIRDILVISTPEDLPQFRRLLGDGERLGVRFAYAEQPQPGRLAQAFLIGRDWIAGEPCALALGDNLIHGDHLSDAAARRRRRGRSAPPCSPTRCATRSATAWSASMPPAGAVEMVEKPRRADLQLGGHRPVFLRSRASATSRPQIKPSARGELEITDLNRVYLEMGTLHVEKLSRGCAWLDAGTPDSLLQAATFVQTIQSRTGHAGRLPGGGGLPHGLHRCRPAARSCARASARPNSAACCWNSPKGRLRVKVERLAIADVMLITPPRFSDPRGFFSETWNARPLRRGRHPGPVRAGQPRRSRPAAACCADCTARSAPTRRASWCAW